MADKIIGVKKYRWEQKKREIKEKVKIKIHDGLVWVNDNKEFIVVAAPAVAGAIKGTVKLVGKCIDSRREKELKDLYCYDRSGGHYWRLKRDLSTQEWLEFDKRRSNGERVADILSDMRVLK